MDLGLEEHQKNQKIPIENPWAKLRATNEIGRDYVQYSSQ